MICKVKISRSKKEIFIAALLGVGKLSGNLVIGDSFSFVDDHSM